MKEMIEKLKKMSLIKKNYNYLYSCSHFSSILCLVSYLSMFSV